MPGPGDDPSNVLEGSDVLDSSSYDSIEAGLGLDSGGYGPSPEEDLNGASPDDSSQGAILPGEDMTLGFGDTVSGVVDTAGGFVQDYTAGRNYLSGIVPADYNIGGPYGITSTRGPNLGVTPMPPPPGMARSQAAGLSAREHAILLAIAARIGKHVARRVVAAIIRKWGMGAASSAFGVAPDDLMFLWSREEVKSHRRRRGPHLYTIAKRIRAAERYRHMLHKLGVKVHALGGRRSSPPPFTRRRKRRK